MYLCAAFLQVQWRWRRYQTQGGRAVWEDPHVEVQHSRDAGGGENKDSFDGFLLHIRINECVLLSFSEWHIVTEKSHVDALCDQFEMADHHKEVKDLKDRRAALESQISQLKQQLQQESTVIWLNTTHKHNISVQMNCCVMFFCYFSCVSTEQWGETEETAGGDGEEWTPAADAPSQTHWHGERPAHNTGPVSPSHHHHLCIRVRLRVC